MVAFVSIHRDSVNSCLLRHRLYDNMVKYFREIGRLGWGGESKDWILLNKWQAFLNTVLYLQIPQNVVNFLTSLGNFNFLRTLFYGVS